MAHPYAHSAISHISGISVSEYPAHPHRRAPAHPAKRPSGPESDDSSASQQPLLADAYARHFVKQDGLITLILAGHKGGGQVPLYTSGSLVGGLVTLSKAAGITSITVKLEGSIKVKETAGGGSASTALVADTLYAWDQMLHAGHAPSEFSFRGKLPAYYFDERTRGLSLLPPSYEARMNALPGFRVAVQYAFVVSVTRARDLPLLWRKTARLRVPFVYRVLTRPAAAGPFPSVRTLAPKHPRTLFTDVIPSRKAGAPPMEVQIYLPKSQISPLADAIPFRISLRAPDACLAPFLAFSSPLTSFHPLSPAPPPAPSVGSLVARRGVPARAPLRVTLERYTTADTRATGVVVLGKRGARITARAVLADGLLHRGEHGRGWVSWWGDVGVPPTVDCGGFEASRLTVEDVLVVTVEPHGVDTHVLPFRRSVPVQLTTSSAKTASAIKVTEK